MVLLLLNAHKKTRPDQIWPAPQVRLTDNLG
jgi:hypothetical protein